MRLAKRIGLGLTLVALAALCTSAMAQQDPTQVDWNNVKQIWNTLTPEEQRAYEELALRRSRVTAFGKPILSKTVGENCATATPELGLPFNAGDDTTGAVDDINLNASGSCAGGGSQFSTTGTGPDLMYSFEVDISCDVDVSMDPTGIEDLALYVITDCGNVATSCLGVDDAGGGGTEENLTFSAAAGTTYYVVIDGFAGDDGPFDLTLNENGATGCTAVPVELQSFSVE